MRPDPAPTSCVAFAASAVACSAVLALDLPPESDACLLVAVAALSVAGFRCMALGYRQLRGNA